ncbi:hypothetical protein [Pollutimonas sp. M17]|nr:hypothetical protein [Pollutimonas sp. M17]UYO92207.1 hypothetical protein OEG81_09710 [Pollutimonas sp. M17]
MTTPSIVAVVLPSLAANISMPFKNRLPQINLIFSPKRIEP